MITHYKVTRIDTSKESVVNYDGLNIPSWYIEGPGIPTDSGWDGTEEQVMRVCQSLQWAYDVGMRNCPACKAAPSDCYHKAEPGEPKFTLLGRDPTAGFLVRLWVQLRRELNRRAINLTEESWLEEAIQKARGLNKWASDLGKKDALELVSMLLSGFQADKPDKRRSRCTVCNNESETPFLFCPECGYNGMFDEEDTVTIA